jgi:hypothetical protein
MQCNQGTLTGQGTQRRVAALATAVAAVAAVDAAASPAVPSS